MTAAGATAGSGGGRGGSLRTVIVIGVIVVAMVIIGMLTNTNRDALPYDPTSSSKTGTKAFVQTIEHFGAEVSVPDRFPPPDTDVAVMFQDVVPPDALDDVREWVAGGRTLVVLAPQSELAPRGVSAGPHATGQRILDQQDCGVDALRGVGSIDRGTTGSIFDHFAVPDGAASCFGDGDEAFVVVAPEGAGQIVSIAGAAMFQNQWLDEADNAVLATALFAPKAGTRVAIVRGDAFAGEGSGDQEDAIGGLGNIISFGVGLAVLQLGVALVVYGFARGRRLGRVVEEPQPVQIAGSELVDAVGNLLMQTKRPDTASALLRADLRRDLCARIGLPPNASAELIADTVAARTAIDRAVVLHAVTDLPVTNGAELLGLATQIDTVREEVLHGHAP